MGNKCDKSSEKYTAILELDKKLSKHGIPHYLSDNFDGYIIEYYSPEGKKLGDVIQHKGSYGNALNLMEAAGFGLKDVKANVSIEEAFALFKKAHEKAVEL